MMMSDRLYSLFGKKSPKAGAGRKSRRISPLGVAVVGALVLAACTSVVADETASGAIREADSGGSALPFDFELTAYQGADALGGERLNLSGVLAQGKPVVLNFWAGLCPPCRLEIPDLQAVNDEFGDRIVLFGLDVGPFTALGSREEGQALLEELGVTYPAGTTFEAQVVREYQITGMPSTFFIAPDGEVVRKWTGLLTEPKMAELVEELLTASGS
jgi:thiol-disulfide isomerase/thioredoxin